MNNEILNHFAFLAAQYPSLLDESKSNEAACCTVPQVDSKTLDDLECSIELVINDIAAGMQGLAHLVTNYPSGIGNEAVVLPQVGRLLHILGDALGFANDASHIIADRRWAHDRIAAIGKASACHGDSIKEEA